jgi:polyhydroxybutyrate depolymerase
MLIDDCAKSGPMAVRAFQGTDDPQPFDGGSFDEAIDWLRARVGDAPVEELLGGSNLDAVDPVMFDADGPGSIEVIGRWAERNGCAETYAESQVTDHVRLLAWDGCPDTAATELYVIEGGGHAWPGSERHAAAESVIGFTTLEIDATELMWEFFEQFQLDERSGT